MTRIYQAFKKPNWLVLSGNQEAILTFYHGLRDRRETGQCFDSLMGEGSPRIIDVYAAVGT